MQVFVLTGSVLFQRKLILAPDSVEAISLAKQLFPEEKGLRVQDETTDVLEAFGIVQAELDTLRPGVLVIRREASGMVLRSIGVTYVS